METRVPFPVYARIRAPFSTAEDGDSGTSHLSIPLPPQSSSSSSVPRRLEVSLIKHSPQTRSSNVVDNSRSSLAFTFTRVFGPQSQQDEVFSESVQPHVAKCLQEGRPLCVCAYGQTGSGKTYSMFGGGKYANRGIVQRTITQVFSYVDAVTAAANLSSSSSFEDVDVDDDNNEEVRAIKEGNTYSVNDAPLFSLSSSSSSSLDQITLRVRLSCLQIYNEQAYDLLDERQQGLPVEKWQPLQVVVNSNISSSSSGGGGSTSGSSVPVRGLRVYDVASEADALTLLLLAHVNRTTAATPMNLASSRSHCLLSLSVDTIRHGVCIKSTQITLVDLAGSERVYKTGTGAPAAAEAAAATGSRKVGQRRTREGKMINLSLHHLQQCIVALQQRTPHTLPMPLSEQQQPQQLLQQHHGSILQQPLHPRFSISSTSSSSSYFFKSRESIGSVSSSGHVSEASSIASRSRASSILGGLMAVPSSSHLPSSSLHNAHSSSAAASSSSSSSHNQVGHTHVPFRNSVLTIALKDFLDGKSLTVFIATLNPEAQYTDESVSTLRFAARCAVLSADLSTPKRNKSESGSSSANTSSSSLTGLSRGASGSDLSSKNDASALQRLSRDKEALIAELQRAISRAEIAEGALRDSQSSQEEKEIQSALQMINEHQSRRVRNEVLPPLRPPFPPHSLPHPPHNILPPVLETVGTSVAAAPSVSTAIENNTSNISNKLHSPSVLTEDEKKSTEEAVAHFVKAQQHQQLSKLSLGSSVVDSNDSREKNKLSSIPIDDDSKNDHFLLSSLEDHPKAQYAVALMRAAVASAVQAAAEAIVSADNTAASSVAASSASLSFRGADSSTLEDDPLLPHQPTSSRGASLLSSSSSSYPVHSPSQGTILSSQYRDLLLQGQVFLKFPSSKGSILARPGLRSLYVDKNLKALHWKHLDSHPSSSSSTIDEGSGGVSSNSGLLTSSSTTNFALISSLVDVSDGSSSSSLIDSDNSSSSNSADKRSRRSLHNHHSGLGGAPLVITFKERILDLEVPTLGASSDIAIRVRDLWREALLWLARETEKAE